MRQLVEAELIPTVLSLGNPVNRHRVMRTTSVCCEMLRSYLEYECPMHPEPWACPDRLFYRAADGEIGIVVHNGEPVSS